jgi:hypothetical protein
MSFPLRHVYSILAEARKVNPCLRFNDARIVAILRKRQLPADKQYDRWESLISIEEL